MKIGIIVQRYGMEINGGAELHARWIAEKLQQNHDVTVLTTCALDYQYWKNHYKPGKSVVNDIPVIRFKVKRGRRGHRFIGLQNLVFFDQHSEKEERAWVRENGPFTPALVSYVAAHQNDYDCFIFFSYRYYTTFEGLQRVSSKALLVPTAEEDPAIHLEIVKKFFRLPAGIVYNSYEEKALINNVSHNERVPGDVVGVGINVLQGNAERFREKYGISGPYLLYVGRIDKNKGCDRLFDYMLRYLDRFPSSLQLVLVGGQYMTVPKHEKIVAVGFVSEQDKFDAIAGTPLFIIPSYYESLCMALLEAWALKRPVLVNGLCKVLKGQVQRGNGGLYYQNYSEFEESLEFFRYNADKAEIMGQQGFEYFTENYDWPVIMAKYDKLLALVRS